MRKKGNQERTIDREKGTHPPGDPRGRRHQGGIRRTRGGWKIVIFPSAISINPPRKKDLKVGKGNEGGNSEKGMKGL